MLELLLSSGETPTPPGYPDSGPGPKTLLAGDEQLGYFGDLTGEELFTAAEMFAAIPLSVGVDIAVPAKPWLKFFFKGKVLYIAKKPLKSNVSWNDIYAVGGVYGTNDNGLYPAATPVNQYHPMTKVENGRTWTLVPRLIRAVNSDPANSGSYAMAGYDQSEWSQLFGRVVNAANDVTTEKWARFTNGEVGGTSNFFNTVAMETYGPNVTYGAIAGNGGGFITRLNQTKVTRKYTYEFGWRPVLDLIS